MEIIKGLGFLVIGFLLLVKGADWFVNGASGIAKKLGIPTIVIGLTIVAMGTSAPEAAVSITSAMKGSADLAVGNVLGSNILNILIILGITAFIVPLPLKSNTIRYEIPFLLMITFIFAIIGLNDEMISIVDAIILLILFGLYLFYLFIMTKKGLIEGEDEIINKSIPMLLFLTGIGVIAIVGGSQLAIDGATTLARLFGVSERIIGLTIVALGTSLPELVTCIVAATKKEVDIAIGNIIGSNIFNILFVIGLSGIVTPVIYQSEFLLDSLFAIGSTILLFILCLNKDYELKRWGGFVLLIAYVGYFITLIY